MEWLCTWPPPTQPPTHRITWNWYKFLSRWVGTIGMVSDQLKLTNTTRPKQPNIHNPTCTTQTTQPDQRKQTYTTWQIFFGTHHFSVPKIIVTNIFQDLKFLGPKFFRVPIFLGVKICSGPKFFWDQNFSGTKFFLDSIFFRSNFHWDPTQIFWN